MFTACSKFSVRMCYVSTAACIHKDTDKSIHILGEMFFFVIFKHRNTNKLKQTRNSIAVAGSTPDEFIGFFNSPNPSSRTMELGSTQPLTEMSTRNLPGRKRRPARKADLHAICEPVV
jgi:hypothetical protein